MVSKHIINSKIIYWNHVRRGFEIHKKFNGKWESVYVLQDVAARFWELFTEFKSFDEIARIISIEYNADKKRVERDLESFMNELRKEKVIIEAGK